MQMSPLGCAFRISEIPKKADMMLLSWSFGHNTARLRVSTAFWFPGLWVGYILINHNIHNDISSFKL